jgi:phytoene synthase
MRALPVNDSRGIVTLPADALRSHGTSPEEVLAGKNSEGLLSVLAELRDKASKALAEAQSEVDKLEPRARTAFLPLCLVEPNLASLAKERDPLHIIVGINPLYRLWRMALWR